MDRIVRLKKHYLSLLAVLLFAITVAGCGVHKPFALMDQNTQIRKGSVAVISGDASEPTQRLAEYITLELRQKSTFRVMSQDEIGRRVGKYPINIRRADPENVDKPVWIARGEKGKLDAMQDQLKTDYLLVVWTANLSRVVTTYSNGGGKVSYFAGIVGNLYDYPKAKPIAFSNYGNSKDQTCCLFGKSEGDDINDLLKYSGEELAQEFMQAANAEKPRK
jgi:hypothetical protein